MSKDNYKLFGGNNTSHGEIYTESTDYIINDLFIEYDKYWWNDTYF